MNIAQLRNLIPALLLWARRLFPYLVFFTGAVMGSAAIIRIMQTSRQQQLRELAWLGVSLLLFWLAIGLLERNERSWRLYQGSGAVVAGGLGLAILIIIYPDAQYWMHSNDAYATELGLPWIVTGLALLIWSIALIANNGGACFLWQLTVMPLAIGAFWWWQHEAGLAIETGHTYLVLLSALFFAASMLVLVIISRHANLSLYPSAPARAARKSWHNTKSFPSTYHELLERGHFCELFEVPCSNPCPLPTSIVAKYQRRRIQYRLYPEILEPFEQAYAILVTPQLRELCKVAHEIIQAKEKQLGPKRFQEMEIYLWKTLWDRLQNVEYKGNPQKALREKARLLKEIMPPDAD